MRCQQWYDDGNHSYEQQREHERKLLNAPLGSFRIIAGPPGIEVGSPYYKHPTVPMRRGSEGFYIACAHCRKEFESKGLRCCSKECESAYRERQDNLAVMAEAGIEPSSDKRICAAPDCGARIPVWRNGRKVSSATRFCSPKCKQKAHRAALSPKPGFRYGLMLTAPRPRRQQR
jgi:hypothetical protein